MPKIIFLDTNILLHYQPFDQIDWSDILHTDAVTIIFLPVNIRELNHHKDGHSQAHIRQRAANTIRKLTSLHQNEAETSFIKHNIQVIIEYREPLLNFEEYQLRSDIQDDHLIASIIMYKNENPSAEVVLITSDMGLTLTVKSNRYDIPSVELTDKWRIPAKPTATQKENQKLKEELQRLRSRLPDISLILGSKDIHAEYVIRPPKELVHEELERELEQLKQQYPFKTILSQRVSTSGTDRTKVKDIKQTTQIAETIARLAQSTEMFSKPLPEQVEKYNQRLEQFYSDHIAYLKANHNYQNLNRRSIKLQITLINRGTAPATDIDVELYFPDGFRLLDERSFPKPPKRPKPPSPPKSAIESFLSRELIPSSPYIHAFSSSLDIPAPNVSPPDIKQTNSYEVSFNVSQVKHHQEEPLGSLYVVFESYESASSFHIDYELLAENLPDKVTGKLHIVVEKGN